MRIKNLILIFSAIVLSGCVVRTYSLTKDRVDQDLNRGNMGFLKGSVPQEEKTKERKRTRTNRVVEFEFRAPLKFETLPRQDETRKEPQPEAQERVISGNRGYISQNPVPEITIPEAASGTTEKYTVQKGDTLQKISVKVFGTSTKWYKIYQTNKDTMKTPNKIYPGQVLNIPSEQLKEIRENLK